MKIKKLKSLLYIFSSVMVLGLALLSFDAQTPEDQEVSYPKLPTPTTQPDRSPTGTTAPTATSTPGVTLTATPLPTSIPTPTSTPTPTPTPTPSLAEQNAALAIRPATDEVGAQLTTVITDYLTEFYSNEELQVNDISNITCYYKEGLADVDYIVYVSYDINYKQSNVLLPTIEEYCISYEGEVATVLSDPQNADVCEALFLSRTSESVCNLYMKETIRRYLNLKLLGDEALLASIVTDPSLLDMEDIRQKTQYYMSYHNHEYIIHSCPEEVTEFDYIVYVTYDIKLINIATHASGMSTINISLDENNYPKIFYGVTSKTTDSFRAYSQSQKDVQTAYANVIERFSNAMSLDADLREFYERANNPQN